MRRGLLLLGASLLLAGCDPKGVYDGRPAPGTVTLGGLLCPPAYAHSTEGPNLFVNGDVEAGLPSVGSGSLVLGGSQVTAVQDAGMPYAGTYSLKVSALSGSAIRKVSFGSGALSVTGLEVGKTYVFRAMVVAISGFTGSPQIAFLGQALTPTVQVASRNLSGYDAWTAMDVVFKVGANVTNGEIYTNTTSAGVGFVYFLDNLELREVLSVEPSPCPSPTPVPSVEPSPVPSSEPSPLPSGAPTPAPGGGSDAPQYFLGFSHDQAKERLLQLELMAKILVLPWTSLLLVWVVRRKVYML